MFPTYTTENHTYLVSTNVIKQISRRFHHSRRDLRKIQDMFALLRPPSESWNTHYGYFSSPQPNRNLGERHKLPHRGPGQSTGRKRVLVHLENTSDGDKFRIFATNIYAYFYDWKPMRSIFDILHKNFEEDQLNSRSFLGFPGVVDTRHPVHFSRLGFSELLWQDSLQAR